MVQALLEDKFGEVAKASSTKLSLAFVINLSDCEGTTIYPNNGVEDREDQPRLRSTLGTCTVVSDSSPAQHCFA